MNISGIKFLNPIKQVSFNKSAQNPINFRGGLKNDSFERTFDNSKKNDDEQIIALEDKVRKISREIFHLRSGKLSLREEIRDGLFVLRHFSLPNGCTCYLDYMNFCDFF